MLAVFLSFYYIPLVGQTFQIPGFWMYSDG